MDGNYRHVSLPNLDELDQRSLHQPIVELEEAFAWRGGIELEPDISLARSRLDERSEIFVAVEEVRDRKRRTPQKDH